MTQRSRLKFNGVIITDDGINTVIQGIKGSDIYYDKIMENLYANYDIYFEEI